MTPVQIKQLIISELSRLLVQEVVKDIQRHGPIYREIKRQLEIGSLKRIDE